MAKGYNENQERLHQLSLLGKPLARRAGRKCELCEASGVEMRPYEIPPVPAEASLDRLLLLCETCSQQLKDYRKLQPERWRCLETAIWSTEAGVQVVAARLLRRLVPITNWAGGILEMVDLDGEIEEWVEKDA